MPRPAPDPRTRPGAIALAAALCLLAGSGCSLKWAFIELSYADPPPTLPSNPDVGDGDEGPDLAYAAYTALLPTLLSDYARPPAVGRCLAAIVEEPDDVDTLLRYGSARAYTRPMDWYTADPNLYRLDDLWDPWPDGCDGGRLTVGDQVRLGQSLAASGETAVRFALLSVSGSITSEDVYRSEAWNQVKQGYTDALATAGALLRADPSADGDGTTDRRRYPSLVLSGGAGNGSFAAGYTYELLYLRQQALALSGDHPAFHAAVEEHARFGSVAATSVGALIAVAVDLYYAGHPDEGLELLRTAFIVDEWDLFAVCRGGALSLVTVDDGSLLAQPQQGILRFDPLMDGVLGDTLARRGDAILDNDLVRVTTAVEANQGLLALLDERACRLLDDADARQACLRTAIKASISEPALAAPVPRVYSGLRADGEPGTWLDGGLRSGSPATIGSSYNGEWGRVLAVNTHRHRGVPREGFDNAAQLALRTITTFTEQTRAWELAYAQLDDEARHAARCRVETHLGLPNERGRPCVVEPQPPTDWPAQPPRLEELCADDAATTAARQPDPSQNLPFHDVDPDDGSGFVASPPPNGWLYAVYVPESLPEELFTSGYAFDRDLLTGLWLAGRRTFLRDSQQVFNWLGPGWDAMRACRFDDACPPAFADLVDAEIADTDAAWDAWLEAWTAVPADERIRAHRAELRKNLDSCVCEQDHCRE